MFMDPPEPVEPRPVDPVVVAFLRWLLNDSGDCHEIVYPGGGNLPAVPRDEDAG